MPENILDFLFDPLVSRSIAALIGFLVIGLLARWLQRWLTRHIQNQRTISSVGQVIRFLSYLAAVLLVFTIFSGQLPGLTVTLGVAGAGIAFALQEVIASLAGWIAISFGQFYAIGDRVQLGGIRGDVIQIGVLRTTLMEIGEWVRADQYNGRVVRISNAFVFKEPVFNYSEEISFIWDEISIPVRYGSEHRLAREIMLQAADAVFGASIERVKREWDVMRQKYPLEHASVEPRVFLIANDNWMQIALRYPVDAKHRRTVHDELFMYILDAIAETEGRVALASATFELAAAPALDVRLHSGHKAD
ncbi:MAG TPA: mechanosensitive ion channel [Chloroflexi bacterium]|nr:mechanosensitive ion channel [Chloroflexota bacterium]